MRLATSTTETLTDLTTDLVIANNNNNKKLNPVWKGIWVVNKIMSAVLLEIKNNKKVCVVHHDTIKKCGDGDFPRWVERLRGQIKEREGAKEGLREDKNVGSGEVEGELSSVAGEEIVDEIPGGDGGHSQEDEGSLADAESTSDTLAYEGGIGQKYVKKQKRKRKVPKWLDHYVGSGEVEGELSSVAGEEIVDEIPGGDGGHSQEDEGSLADAE